MRLVKKSLHWFIVTVFLLSGLEASSSLHAAQMKRGLKGESTGLVTAKGQKWIEILEVGVVRRYILFGTLRKTSRRSTKVLLKRLRTLALTAA